MHQHARSLDRLAPGETVTVERILFDAVRSHCAERGVREGVQLSCRKADGDGVVVETAGGRAVPCDGRLARFVEVTGTEGAAQERAGWPPRAAQETE